VSSLARLALDNKYVKPTIVEGNIIDIKGGRHPVVENFLLKDGEKFTENDCLIDDKSVISIVTGPNMGGKSTYLRQNAIIVIMAQMGSYVPAREATIGVVDKIFSRVGASDDISSGKSTFMVEMIETSVILRQATKNSFVILDEIGRGTSTYDGLAIAWAIIEEIHNSIGARTLFATHYHEFKNLSEYMENIQFLTVCVDESDGEISFTHRLKNGFADKSYGIHVASLAGFPEKVVHKAEELLQRISG
jgi:DNA mismatch repair protein MutS